jgi:hypothetical protein
MERARSGTRKVDPLSVSNKVEAGDTHSQP